MTPTIVRTKYSPSYLGVCVVNCGWFVLPRNTPSSVTKAALDHVKETGHETAVVRESSVHWFVQRDAMTSLATLAVRR